jgi:thymidylate kinase
MKMKLVSVAFFLVTLILFLALEGEHAGLTAILLLLLVIPFVFAAGFAAYGIARSLAAHINPMNDLPNALRVFLASLGGSLVTLTSVFLFPSLGIMLFVGAIYLNDEFQRRAIHAFRTGTKGGSIALLGIDGSGKSSHSSVTGDWLRQRGYRCDVMPFHRYLFVERLAMVSSAIRRRGSKRKEAKKSRNTTPPRFAGVSAAAFSPPSSPYALSRPAPSSPSSFLHGRRRNPLRPVLSLMDNLLLQLSSSIGCRLEGKVIIYDRFIWSTYIKYKALGYPVRLLSVLYLLPEPTYALVLDVPVSKSLRVIDERVNHIHYPAEILQAESDEYLSIARRKGYPIIDATAAFEEVQERIQSSLNAIFPPVRHERRRGARES